MEMGIRKMTKESIPQVANMMCTVKPDWWDYEGAVGQLSGTEENVKFGIWNMAFE